MSMSIYHSREQAYKGDFSAKVVISNFQLADTYLIIFKSHDKIVTSDHKKLIVESIPYVFKARIYPVATLATNPSFVLNVKWIFDDGSYETDTYEETLTKGDWRLIEHLFVAPSHSGKNLFYANVFITVKYSVGDATVTLYMDEVQFYPFKTDQTILTEDGRYWISILKGYQFIDGMGHRVVIYEADVRTVGVLKQIFMDGLVPLP